MADLLRGRSSAIHPDAERLREWRAMLEKKGLSEGYAARPLICADCGKPTAEHEPVVEQDKAELATHLACAAWWWNWQPVRAVDFDIAS